MRGNKLGVVCLILLSVGAVGCGGPMMRSNRRQGSLRWSITERRVRLPALSP